MGIRGGNSIIIKRNKITGAKLPAAGLLANSGLGEFFNRLTSEILVGDISAKASDIEPIWKVFGQFHNQWADMLDVDMNSELLTFSYSDTGEKLFGSICFYPERNQSTGDDADLTESFDEKPVRLNEVTVMVEFGDNHLELGLRRDKNTTTRIKIEADIPTGDHFLPEQVSTFKKIVGKFIGNDVHGFIWE